jgi:hypothetical protein
MLLFALALRGEQEPADSYLCWIPPNSQREVQIVFISVKTFLIINMLNNNKSCQKVKSYWEKFIPLNTNVSTDTTIVVVDLTRC